MHLFYTIIINIIIMIRLLGLHELMMAIMVPQPITVITKPNTVYFGSKLLI